MVWHDKDSVHKHGRHHEYGIRYMQRRYAIPSGRAPPRCVRQANAATDDIPQPLAHDFSGVPKEASLAVSAPLPPPGWHTRNETPGAATDTDHPSTQLSIAACSNAATRDALSRSMGQPTCTENNEHCPASTDSRPDLKEHCLPGNLRYHKLVLHSPGPQQTALSASRQHLFPAALAPPRFE